MQTAGDLTIQELSGSTLQRNDAGTDELVRIYQGLASLVPAFTANLLGSRDTTYITLICDNFTVKFLEGGLAEIEVIYHGIGATNPNPDPSGVTTIINEVGLNNYCYNYTDSDGEDRSVNFSYYCPRTTYQYTRRSRPLSPQFGTILETNFDMLPFNPNPRPSWWDSADITNLTTQDIVTSFRTVLRGDVYECEETVERMYDSITFDY